jgi:hypothetical protein
MKNKKLNLVDWVTILGILSSAALVLMYCYRVCYNAYQSRRSQGVLPSTKPTQSRDG